MGSITLGSGVRIEEDESPGGVYSLTITCDHKQAIWIRQTVPGKGTRIVCLQLDGLTAWACGRKDTVEKIRYKPHSFNAGIKNLIFEVVE